MNVYEQVEKLLNEHQERPKWADEILFELKELKRILQDIKKENHHKSRDKSEYFAFVKRLREELRADISNDIYPQIEYKGKEFGINFKGFIYDKETTKVIPAFKAFEIYRFLYDNRENIEKYLSKL